MMPKKLKTKYGTIDVFKGSSKKYDLYFLEGKSYQKFGIACAFKDAKDFEKQYEAMLPHYMKFYPEYVHKPKRRK